MKSVQETARRRRGILDLNSASSPPGPLPSHFRQDYSTKKRKSTTESAFPNRYCERPYCHAFGCYPIYEVRIGSILR